MYKIELIFVVFCLVNAYLIDTCKLVPSNYQSRDKRLPGDNGFKIVIGGNSTKYVPGEIYTVYLLGSRTHEKVQYFKRFLLNVQSSNDKRSPSKAGSFQLFKDSLATFNENCINTISEENDLQKTEVYVMWTAPPVGSGCVTFRAMVLENSKRWFSEAGQLTKEFCEQNVLELPQHETHECCARDEAKYNLIFEGIWSNQTHAKDFPFSLWLTHFSDLIGASHVNNFSFWGEGQIATDGFRSLAEWGSIRLIREELSKKKAYVKQVFSAPGLWYPNVNTNTSARFYVDRKRHFLSLASMFGPSPDWFVGVNGLNLCLKNCSWIQNLIVDLYPWDAGTDSGITYMSPNLETIPREKMYKITTMYPEDPRAPFYDSHKNEMLPLARFYFELEKLIPKSYDFDFLQKQLSEMESASDLEEDKRFECRVSEYSNWTKCSVECGKGLRMRDRHYLMPEKAKMSGCNQQLVSKEMCAADIAECPKTDDLDTDMLLSGNDETKDEDENGICKTSGWSEWSECSEKCGIGFRMRTKTFMDRMGQKKCPHIQTSEKEKCMQPPCSETDIESIDPMCPTTDWSDWSPCSEQCGTGFRTRLRLLLVDSDLLEKCKTRVRLEQKEPCNDTKACLKAKGLWNRCPNKKNRCMKKRKVGSCDSQLTRWYFNAEKLSCLSFVYSGCKGNDNNFESLEACNQVCGLLKGNSINSNVQNLTAPIDCLVSDWSDWSGCSTDCGTGIKKRFRTILVKNENGGKNCPRLLQRRKCIQNQCV